MKIDVRLKRNGREIDPSSLGKVLSDEIQNYVQDLVGKMPEVLLGMSAQPSVSPGVTSDRAQKYPSSGGGSVASFDEVHESKTEKVRKRRDVDDE